MKYFHGTTSKNDLKLGDFLLPGKETGNTVSSEGGENENVFLADNFEFAFYFANRTCKKLGGDPVVFEVEPENLWFYMNLGYEQIYICSKAKIKEIVEGG